MSEVVLRDGTQAMIWPLLATDRATLVDGFARLSEGSRARRFLGPIPALSESMLNRLVEQVDGTNHIALVLTAYPRGDVEDVAGVGRIIRYPERPSEADVAVTVQDAWQGRGVGTALLRELVTLRPPGVVRIVTEVTNDNTASLNMLARIGPPRLAPTDDGTYVVSVTLPPEPV
jgi:RimJ/RimL family protein N-acetyltransferase